MDALLRLARWAFSFAALVATASALAVPLDAASPRQPKSLSAGTRPHFSKAAGPRLGQVFEVQVVLTDRSQLAALTDYDVTRVRGDSATVSATAEELEALRRAGFEIVSVKSAKRAPALAPDRLPTRWSWSQFHDHAAITSFVQDLATSYPEIVKVVSIGNSAQGRAIWAVKISDQPNLDEAEPEVRFVGAIHGDEVVGIEMNLRFLDLLTRYYGKSRRVTALVDNHEIWVIPLWNPDGNASESRHNANGYDLNRVFPDETALVPSNVLYGPARSLSQLDAAAPEVAHYLRFAQQRRFVVGASFHGGAVVTVYPWSASPDDASEYTPTPDNGVFVELADAFASHNLVMRASTEFTDGIENSAAWYAVIGCSQDWAYKVTGMLDLDVELTETKWPTVSVLEGQWALNREAMMAVAEFARRGVHGLVTDSATKNPVHAAIKVVGYDHLTFTDPAVGDYHRPLQPGTYDLRVSAPGYASKELSGVVVSGRNPTHLDVQLDPVSARQAYKIDFRPADGITLNGFLVDNGLSYGSRGNGLYYGWDAAPCMRSRKHLFSQDASFDAFADMQRCSGRVWEMALPNGSYRVHLVAGDAAATSFGAVRISVEGTVFAGTTSSSDRWTEGSVVVTVSDGQLTLSNATGAAVNNLCSVEITMEPKRSEPRAPAFRSPSAAKKLPGAVRRALAR